MEDFSHPIFCWMDKTSGHKKSGSFLEKISENFLMEMIEKPARRGVLLDLIVTNKQGLAGM